MRRARPRPSRVRVALSVLLVGGGCGGGAAEDADFARRPMLSAERTLLIGSLDDPETALTAFFVLDRAPDGRIYTLHNQEAVVRIHSPDGEPIGSFGGEGEGPGELLRPPDMRVDGDEVWVLNGTGGRISYFTLDGEFLRDETFRPETPEAEEGMFAPPPFPVGRLEDGSILTMVVVFDPNRPYAQPEIPMVRMGLDGSVIDTVGIRPGGEEGVEIATEGGPTIRAPQPFSQEPLLRFFHHQETVLKVERAARSDVRTFRVVRTSFAGDTVFDRAYGFEPVPITAAMVDSTINEIAEGMEQPGFITAGRVRARLEEAAIVPPHLPPVRYVWVGEDGTIWLALSGASPSAVTWLVLEEAGEPLGEVSLPRTFSPLMATRDEVWGRELDEFDVPYIAGYAIRPATAEEAGS